jgi:hypothetical protein
VRINHAGRVHLWEMRDQLMRDPDIELFRSAAVHGGPGPVDQAKCAGFHNRSVVERIARRPNGPALPVQRGGKAPLSMTGGAQRPRNRTTPAFASRSRYSATSASGTGA